MPSLPHRAYTAPGNSGRLERAGIAVVGLKASEGPQALWHRLQDLCARAIRELKWNDFLVLEYDAATTAPDTPAAWVRTGPRGVECAVSSAQQLPDEVWPHHTEFFEQNRWRVPVGPDQPWTSGPHDPVEAAGRVITALRDGRGCEDPYGFHWGAGSFPVPDGHTGTLTVIDPEQCSPTTDTSTR